MFNNEDGCPCNENCCNEPDTVHPHDCDEKCEEVCDSYTTECLNCGRSCGCDL